MKVAILADIHGNLEALEAVTSDLGLQGATKVICLGDLIGYGPDPEAVVSFVRSHQFESVLGNHEFALNDVRGRRWLNFQAAENNALAEKLLSPDNLSYCVNLPKFYRYRGGYFVHGYPPESVFRYLHRQSDERILELVSKYSADVYFLGHTHKMQLVAVWDQRVQRAALGEGETKLDVNKKYIVNCGSVGQPRVRDNRSQYVLWDPDENSIEVRCVVYDNQKTIKKVQALGLPEAYAWRLR